MNSVPECDWKVFKKLHPVALDRFCHQVLEKAKGILSQRSDDSHNTYIALYKLFEERDEELARIFNDYRRSTAFLQIAMMYDRKLITEEEFQQFHEETTRRILSLREVFYR